MTSRKSIRGAIEDAGRRHFVRTMSRIRGAGVSLGAVPSGLFAQAASSAVQDSIGVGWLRLACTGQSFVGDGAGHGAWQQLMVRHEMFNAGVARRIRAGQELQGSSLFALGRA